MIRAGRIRIDIDAAVIKTVGPIGGRIKGAESILQDRSGPPSTPVTHHGPASRERISDRDRSFARSLWVMNGWCRALTGDGRPRNVITIPHRHLVLIYPQQRFGYSESMGFRELGARAKSAPHFGDQQHLERVSLGWAAFGWLSLRRPGARPCSVRDASAACGRGDLRKKA